MGFVGNTILITVVVVLALIGLSLYAGYRYAAPCGNLDSGSGVDCNCIGLKFGGCIGTNNACDSQITRCMGMRTSCYTITQQGDSEVKIKTTRDSLNKQ